MVELKEKIEKYEQLGISMAATFLWGLAAHMYRFTNGNFSHDSLNEFHGAIFGSDWKISLGRVFVPLYRDLFRSDATLPWLIGLLSLVWIGLAVFLTVRIFRVESKLLTFLTAGIFITNISVSATAATYLHDLDSYMLSVLLAVAAVYEWDRWTWGSLVGAALLAVSLGLYQGYVCVAITLALFVCILDLMDGRRFRYVFIRGCRAIGMLLLGGVLYYIAMKAVQWISQVPMATDDYNTLDQMLELTPRLFLESVAGAYQDCLHRLWNAYSTYPAILVKAITAALLAVSALALIVSMRKAGWPERLLCLALVALLPLGMDFIYVLTIGYTHDLMVYGIWLFYLLALLLVSRLTQQWKDKVWRRVSGWRPGKLLGTGCALLVAVLLYGNVQFANGMYLKKDMEYNAYLSLMTRVVYRMEDWDGYVPEQTQVFFYGLPENLNAYMPGFKEYRPVDGLMHSEVIWVPTRQRFQAYFDYCLGTPVNLVDEETWARLQQDARAAAMPCYPDQGCMAVIDNVLVVKLGQISD